MGDPAGISANCRKIVSRSNHPREGAVAGDRRPANFGRGRSQVTFALCDLDNPLIKKGLTAQFAKRRARVAAGEKSLGWKVGLGAPAVLQRLGLAAPLVGFLMQRALVLSGGGCRSRAGPARRGAGTLCAHGDRPRQRRNARSDRSGNQGDLAGDRACGFRTISNVGQSRRCARRRHLSATHYSMRQLLSLGQWVSAMYRRSLRPTRLLIPT
jgi:hypothetical protein